MILFIGQVGRGMRDREAFQEIDYRRMYGQLAKWVAEIDDPARIPEYVSRAFHTAMAGRPGPVVLALPEDVLTESTVVADVPACRPGRGYPGAAEMAELRERLGRAKRPFVLLGGGGWSRQAKADMETFAEANDLPVGCAFRCQDYFDNTHGCYAGDVGIAPNPKLAERVREADLLLVVGARLGEMTTAGYTLVEPPVPRQTLVHVHPGAEELGRVYQPALAIQAATPAFAAAAREMPPIENPAWTGAAARAHADYLDWSTPRPVPGPLQMAEVMAWLRERLPAEAIVCNGAGNYAGFVHRYHRYRAYRSQLAPTSGSMGSGVPAAVAAKLTRPERPVVAFAGDGCFLMTGQELATAVHHGAAIVVIVVNNSMYGTIRMHQEREYPGRVSGTALTNPDFAALARAYGAHGEVVETTEAFAPAFERAMESGKPAVLELRIDPEAISTTRTLSDIRNSALAKVRRA
jgi:acetolactate synthase-1/2/3 large subunit